MRFARQWPEAKSRRSPAPRGRSPCLEGDVGPALEREDATRVVRLRHLETESLDDFARPKNLRCVRFRQPTRAEPQAVLEPDADMTTHGRRHRGDRKLIASRTQDAPLILVAEQAVRGALHVHDVVRVATDAAQNAKNALNEKWRLDQRAIEKVARGIKMADVVALDLEARPIRRARGEDVLDILEGVLEDAIVGRREVGLLPIELPLFEPLQHR